MGARRVGAQNGGTPKFQKESNLLTFKEQPDRFSRITRVNVAKYLLDAIGKHLLAEARFELMKH